MPPLTGLVEIYGSEIARAGQIACQEINENGGVLGRPLELFIEDDGSLPESAVVAAENLIIRDHCTAIIGNLLSNSRIAVAYRVAEPRKVPFLNFSFYEGSIVSRYFFHFAALPNQQIERMIPYMSKKFGPRVFFAGNNYEWPRGSIHAGKLALKEAGGEVVGEEYCPIGVSIEDIEILLDQVEEVAPDIFVPYFAGADQLALLTRFTERGLKKNITVVMGHYDEVMASNLPPEVREGFYSSNTYFMTVDTAENKKFLERLANYPKVTGVWPQGNGILTNFGEGAYICVKAFAEAANRAGNLETEALIDELEKIDIRSPQGAVKMNSQHHHSRVNTYLSQCGADGVFRIIEEFGAIDPVLPERYNHQSIKQSTTLEEDFRLQARILELMSEGVFIARMDDKSVVYANSGAEKMFGFESGELLGHHITEFCLAPEGGAQSFFEDVFAVLARKGEWQGEIRRERKSDTDGTCSMSVFVFTHPVHGEVWIFVATDISEHIQAQNALRESEERYAFAVTGTNDGLWDWNIETNENYMSPRFKEILGYQDDELENKVEVFFNALHPKDSDRVSIEIQAHFEDHVPFNTEYRLRCKDDTYIWIHAKGLAIRDDSGKALRMAGSISDISEQKRAEAALISSEARLADILEIAPEGVITVSSDMSVSLFNKGAERIFGYSSEEILGCSLETLMPERARKLHRKHVEGFERSNDEYRLMDNRGEICGLRKDGSEFPATASVSKLQTSSGILYTVIIHDISERKQAQRDLIMAIGKAETASHSKSQFLAAVSHELRTPLNAIIGFSQIMKEEYFGPLGNKKYKEYARDIDSSGGHMLALVDDLLDISTIEAGKYSLVKEELSSKEIVIECMDLIAIKAQNSGIHLVIDTPDGLSPLYADYRAMKQILLNLLSNAIKFTPENGKITVSINEDRKYTTFKVIDTGKGIHPEELPRLTDMFVRAEKDAHVAEKGWGLGLAITKSLVDLHDGKMDIKSIVREGTTVMITFPKNEL